MPIYTNATGVPLSLAVFLATDRYDYIPGTISATGLLKSTRQQVLTRRVPLEDAASDIITLVKSRLGTACHDSIELAWKTNYQGAMKALGYPQEIIDRVCLNPDPENLPANAIPVYMEQRVSREIDGMKITGKFDFVAEGRVEDFKTTTVYTWINSNKDDDFQLQGSIYRWLNPKIITQDHMAIQFLFTDWMAGRSADPKYPSYPVMPKKIPLLSLDDTEQYIRSKLSAFTRCSSLQEEELPPCNDKELWRRAPQYKYYKNPQKMARSTKNFDKRDEAYSQLAADNGVGIVVEVPGQVMACNYCAAFSVCTQKDALIADGSLII